MLKNINGAIFDMDGTLVDSLFLWDVIWDGFGKKYLCGKAFKPLDDDEKAVRTMTLDGAMNHIYSVYNIGQNGKELLDTAKEIIKDFYASSVELKKGVLDFLEYCRNKGIKMCVASATDKELIKIALEHCGIEKYFSGILSCAEIGKGKDKPDIYLKAVEYLGTEISETCVFEDSHIAINTASKIGMKTVGIYDKYNFGHQEIEKIATEYIAEGETLKKLIDNGCI